MSSPGAPAGPPPTVEVAPHAVARVAALPGELLAPFGDPTLAAAALRLDHDRQAGATEAADLADRLGHLVPRLADRHQRAAVLAARRALVGGAPEPVEVAVPVTSALDAGLAAELQAHVARWRAVQAGLDELARRHDEVLTAERHALRRVAADPTFARALAVGNGELFDRWWPHRLDAPSPRPRARERRLEHALCNHLLRGVGRTTPSQLWAGVSLVAPRTGGATTEDELRAVAVEAQIRVEVDAEAFAAEPGRRSVDADTILWPEPTLRLHGDGALSVRRGDQLVAGQVDRAHEAALETALAAGVAGTARRHLGAGPAADELVAAGLLVAEGVPRPGAADVWAAAQSLADPRIDALRHACAALGRDLVTLAPDAVRARVRRLDGDVARLRADLGLGAGTAPNGSWVRVTLGVPFRLDAGPGWWRRLEGATGHVLAATGADGMAEHYRRSRAREVRAAWTPGSTLGAVARAWRPPAPPGPDDPLDGWVALAARVGDPALVAAAEAHARRWRAGPPAVGPGPTGSPVAGPEGSLLFRLEATGQLTLTGGRPQAAPFAHRYAPVTAPLLDDLRRWRAEPAPATPLGIVGRHPLNRSATLGPTLADRLDPATLAASRLALLADDRPVLIDPDGRAHLPVYDHSATLGVADALDALLFRLAMSHGWEGVGLGPGLPDDRHRPAATLPDGTVWRPATLVPDAVELRRVLDGATDAERFWRWAALCGRLGLPRRCWVRVGRNPTVPPSLLITDSPLAVRAFLDSLGRAADGDPPSLSLQPGPGDPATWPVAADDGHHLVEVAVSWRDPGYWRAVADPHDPLRADPLDPDEPTMPAGADADQLGAGWVEVRLSLPFDPAAGHPDYPWPLVRRLLASAGTHPGRSYFVRKPPGLRVRARVGDDPGAVAALDAALDAAVADGTVVAHRRSRYEPEVFRFGGPDGLGAFHEVVDAHARLVAGGFAGSLLVAGLTTELFRLLTGDQAEVWDIWMRLAGQVEPVRPARVPEPPPGLAAVLADPTVLPGPTDGADEQAEAVEAARRAGAAAATRVGAAGDDGTLTVGPRAWAAAAALFVWNEHGLGLDLPALVALVDGVCDLLAPDRGGPLTRP